MLEKDFKLVDNKSLGSTSPERRRMAVKLQDAPNLRNKSNKKESPSKSNMSSPGL